MTLSETGLSSAKVSLSGLFEGQFEPCLIQQTLPPLAEAVCRGGWPALVQNPNSDYQLLLNSYFDALFDVNIPRMGLKSQEARNVSLALARNLGTAATLSTIASDARFDVDAPKTSAEKASHYISALESLYVLEPLTGWDAPIRSKSRLRTKPKYYYADPSLAAYLLNIQPDRLLSDGQLFGVLFESLVIHDLLVYSSLLPDAGSQSLYYYRDSDGLETDAIIELRDGRWAAIEVKLGENRVPEACASLNRLKAKIAANPAARNPEPSFLAVIVGSGEYARLEKNSGVYVIPITALGA